MIFISKSEVPTNSYDITNASSTKVQLLNQTACYYASIKDTNPIPHILHITSQRIFSPSMVPIGRSSLQIGDSIVTVGKGNSRVGTFPKVMAMYRTPRSTLLLA